MKLRIRTRHLDASPELLEAMRRRLWFALGRLATAIRTVDVTIADVNGPRGGLDKQCRLRVRGPAVGIAVIEHVGTDALTTVGQAAERAHRAVLRALSRRRAFAPFAGA